MHRIDTPGHDGNTFTTGNPYATPSVPSTIIGAKWCNSVQEELSTFIESQGITLSDTDNTQLASALTAWLSYRLDFDMGRAIYFVAPAPYTAGQALLIGAYFGTIRETVIAGQQAELVLFGYQVMGKVTAEAYTFGDRLYWDDTAKEVTSDGTGSKHYIGPCTVNTPGGSPFTVVHLAGNVHAPPIP